MPFLEVGVVPLSGSLCYFYVVMTGWVHRETRKAFLQSLQCEQGASSLCSPMGIFAETLCLLIRCKGDKGSSALKDVGPWIAGDFSNFMFCFVFLLL